MEEQPPGDTGAARHNVGGELVQRAIDEHVHANRYQLRPSLVGTQTRGSLLGHAVSPEVLRHRITSTPTSPSTGTRRRRTKGLTRTWRRATAGSGDDGRAGSSAIPGPGPSDQRRLPKSERRSRRRGAKSETRALLLRRVCAASREVSSRISIVASAESRCGTTGPPSTARWRSRRELVAPLPQVIAGTRGLLRTVICSMSLPTRTRAPGPGRLTLTPATTPVYPGHRIEHTHTEVDDRSPNLPDSRASWTERQRPDTPGPIRRRYPEGGPCLRDLLPGGQPKRMAEGRRRRCQATELRTGR